MKNQSFNVSYTAIKDYLDNGPEWFHAYYIAKTHRKPPMKDMALMGTAAHGLLLGGFDRRFCMVPVDELSKGIVQKNGKPYANVKATKQYKEKESAWLEANQKGRTLLTPDEFDHSFELGKLAAIYFGDCLLQSLSELERENRATWESPHHGLKCKAFIDILEESTVDGFIVHDLKFTGKKLGTPAAVSNHVIDSGWDIQAAMYWEAVEESEQRDVGKVAFHILSDCAPETKEAQAAGTKTKVPRWHRVEFHRGSPELEFGVLKKIDAMDRLANHVKTGKWSLGTDVAIEMKPWHLKQMRELRERMGR